MSQILDRPGDRVPLRERVGARVAVTAARLLAHLAPRHIVAVLHVLRRRAAPASEQQALRARNAVTGTSTLCAGEYCLQRSLATVLLCRMRGTWPTWCSGVRTPPFSAHAWVEADGKRVGEPASAATYRSMLAVPPRSGRG